MRGVTVLGAGSWGTALAVHLARSGHAVRLWGRDRGLVAAMREERINAAYLPEVTLPAAIAVTADVAEAVDGAGCVVVAVPTHGVRAVVYPVLEELGREVRSRLERVRDSLRR